MLRTGSRGDEVLELQTFLAAQGYNVGPLDGIFGSKTKAAVRSFQSDQGLAIDGIVGPNTFGAIDEIKTAVEDVPQVPDPEVVEVPEVPTDPAFGDDPADDPDLITPEGAEGTPGVMSGGTLHRIDNEEGQEDFYVISYEYPPGSGHEFFYRFKDLATVKATIGDNFGGVTVGSSMAEGALSSWTDAGDSNEIVGITGSFQGFINDIIRHVSAKSGIDDPTRLSNALADPSIQIIMAKAAEGDWTDAQVKAAMRDNDYYKNVVYPGIENFYGQTDNPEAAYAMYKQNVTSNLDTLGTPKDADGSYDSTLKRMLDAKIDDQEFAAFTPTYLRAAGNDSYRASLNQWLTASGVPILTDFDSFFDVLSGSAPQDVKDVVELAGISYVASEQGTNVGEDLVREIAERTDFSESQIAERFLASDRDLLALGPAGLRTVGLTQDDIISTRAGFTTGDRTLAEMEAAIGKAKKEQGIQDDPEATIFTDFNREGAPIKKGLQVNISEGA